ncbi:hypothetical protein SBBP2_20062 [Burkholderiales bacterium]|nr:hypothetical protein SBBP2_20062 [Burkholderiales bacterium]
MGQRQFLGSEAAFRADGAGDRVAAGAVQSGLRTGVEYPSCARVLGGAQCRLQVIGNLDARQAIAPTLAACGHGDLPPSLRAPFATRPAQAYEAARGGREDDAVGTEFHRFFNQPIELVLRAERLHERDSYERFTVNRTSAGDGGVGTRRIQRVGGKNRLKLAPFAVEKNQRIIGVQAQYPSCVVAGSRWQKNARPDRQGIEHEKSGNRHRPQRTGIDNCPVRARPRWP